MPNTTVSNDELDDVYRSTIAIRQTNSGAIEAPAKLVYTDNGLLLIELALKELITRREKDKQITS